MDKKLKNFLTTKGFEFKNDEAYGFVNDFEVSLRYIPTERDSIIFHISFFSRQEEKEIIMSKLKQFDSKIFKFDLTAYGIMGRVVGLLTKKKYEALFNNFDNIINTIDESNIEKYPVCPMCGIQMENPKKCAINGFSISLGQECITEINSSIEQMNTEFENRPNNYGKGILGILLGALIGIVIAFLLSLLGFISALSSVAAIYLGCYFYRIFGGKPNNTMIILSTVISIIALLMYTLIMYMLIAKNGYPDYSLFNAFGVAMKENKDFSGRLVYDMLMTLVFSIIGAGVSFFDLRNKIKRAEKIDK